MAFRDRYVDFSSSMFMATQKEEMKKPPKKRELQIKNAEKHVNFASLKGIK